MELSRPLGTTRRVPQEKISRFPACSVKMDGYWPRSFLRVYGPRLRLGPHKHAKKDLRQYPLSYLDLTLRQ